MFAAGHHCWICSLLVAGLLSLGPTGQAFNVTSVDMALAAAHACRAHRNPALAVTVVKDGAVLMSRGYGVTGPGSDVTVNGSTRFNVASVTKTFTATLLLKLMEEDGRYNLTSKVRDILGESFRLADEFRTQEVTVEDVLSHRVALPEHNRMRYDSNLTRASLQRRLQYLHSPYGFRSVFIYNNLMYGLATRMTEVIANARWEDLVRRHLFEPLGMNKSTFVADTDFTDPGTARPVEEYFGQLKAVSPSLVHAWSELAGSGSVVTTADDMAQWMLFHLGLGRTPSGRRLVLETTLRQLYQPRASPPNPATTKFTRPKLPVTLSYDLYGLGFRRGYYRGHPLVGHSGSTFGYRSLLTLLPASNVGVFVTLSGEDPDYFTRGAITAYLLDKALSEERPWLNSTLLCSFPAPWYNLTLTALAAAVPSLPYDVSLPLARRVEAYLGVYENPAYGTLEVRRWEGGQDEGREDGARLTLIYGVGTWDLVPLRKLASSSSSLSPSSSSLSASSSSSSPSVSSSSAFVTGSPSPSAPSATSQPESFYGKGRKNSAWIDHSPFVFLPSSDGRDVVLELSVPAFESTAPPLFTRRGHVTSASCRLNAYTRLLSLHMMRLQLIVLLLYVLC